MKIIQAVNVNDAFEEGFWYMRGSGLKEYSRNGPVLVAPGPVMTVYHRPQERVLFNAKRDCNPVFHLMESIWMMAGSSDAAWISQFNSLFKTYAEPDGRIHGAYGARWRNRFGMDQIMTAIRILYDNPQSRQVVLGMWHPADDLTDFPYMDRPCNTHAYFDARGGQLNMTVCCRSNDMLWGAYGANAVHMSFLQEVIAHGVNLVIGEYRQFSNNFHLYTDLPMVQTFLDTPPLNESLYGKVRIVPLMEEAEPVDSFLNDCEKFVREPVHIPRNYFLREIAGPLRDIYLSRKAGDRQSQERLREVPECDWTAAFGQWLQRRDGERE